MNHMFTLPTILDKVQENNLHAYQRLNNFTLAKNRIWKIKAECSFPVKLIRLNVLRWVENCKNKYCFRYSESFDLRLNHNLEEIEDSYGKFLLKFRIFGISLDCLLGFLTGISFTVFYLVFLIAFRKLFIEFLCENLPEFLNCQQEFIPRILKKKNI